MTVELRTQALESSNQNQADPQHFGPEHFSVQPSCTTIDFSTTVFVAGEAHSNMLHAHASNKQTSDKFRNVLDQQMKINLRFLVIFLPYTGTHD